MRAAVGSAPLSLCHRDRSPPQDTAVARRKRPGPGAGLARSLARWSGEARLRRERGAGKLAQAGGGRGQPRMPPLPRPPPVPCAAAAAGEGEGGRDPAASPGRVPAHILSPGVRGSGQGRGGKRLRLSGGVGISAHPTRLANLDFPVPTLLLESHPKPDSCHSAPPRHWSLAQLIGGRSSPGFTPGWKAFPPSLQCVVEFSLMTIWPPHKHTSFLLPYFCLKPGKTFPDPVLYIRVDR